MTKSNCDFNMNTGLINENDEKCCRLHFSSSNACLHNTIARWKFKMILNCMKLNIRWTRNIQNTHESRVRNSKFEMLNLDLVQRRTCILLYALPVIQPTTNDRVKNNATYFHMRNLKRRQNVFIFFSTFSLCIFHYYYWVFIHVIVEKNHTFCKSR